MEVPPDELQLGQLLVGLKYRPLREQLSQNAPVTQETSGKNSAGCLNGNRADKAARWRPYPQLHTSMAGVYLSSPRSSSGGRYHSVMTLLVYGRLRGDKRAGLLALTLAPARLMRDDGSPLLRVIQPGQTKVCQLYLPPDREEKPKRVRMACWSASRGEAGRLTCC